MGMWPSKDDESQEPQTTRKRNKDDDGAAEINDEATLDDFEPVADDGNPDDRRRDPLRR
jgi:hypothetical protein